jgi:tripartite-type tricarboxylate transporter receptor subunit TctC
MPHLTGRAALLALATLALSAPGHAQNYPTETVTIVSALGAGTGVDVTARLYAERLHKRLGQPFVVDNRPGGAQLIAIDAVKKAPPNGYTLGVFTSAAIAMRPTMLKKPTYDPMKDFIPIAQYLKSAFAIVVDPKLPVKNVDDLVRYIKSQGGKVTFGISSIGGAPHLAGAFFANHFGVELSPVPYKQSPQAFADVAAGHLPMSIADVGTSLPLIQSGKLRALAVTSGFRLAPLPDVPTLAEVVKIKDFELVSWHVLNARAGTPMPIVNKLHDEMKSIMAEPDVVKRVASLGLLPHPIPPIKETQAYIQSEIDKWGDLIRKLGLAGSI